LLTLSDEALNFFKFEVGIGGVVEGAGSGVGVLELDWSVELVFESSVSDGDEPSGDEVMVVVAVVVADESEESDDEMVVFMGCCCCCCLIGFS
jgi:hypothetical protein